MTCQSKLVLPVTICMFGFSIIGCSDNQELSSDHLQIERASNEHDPDEIAEQDSIIARKADSSDSIHKIDSTDNELPSLEDVVKNPRDPDQEDPYVDDEEYTPEIQTIDIPETWKRLSEEHEVWVDFKNKEVVAGGNICMSAGPLEVFACPRRTKEHESVVSVNALSSQIHAALLAIGAEPGHPVKWQDKYEPASGPVIEISLIWKSEQGVTKRRAQDLVRNVKTNKPMQLDWVFGGSQTFTDEETGETFYYGDSGELVCLSNFSTATMDVPIQSSDANEGLLFEANTENIPERETKVYLVFKPVINKK